MNSIKEKVPYPSDWKVKKLGELGTFLKGKGISKSETIESGLPCIRYGEIYTRHHDYIKEFYSFVDEDTANKSTEIMKGDILFAGSGETAEEIGKSVAYLHEEKAYAGGDIIILRTKDVDSKYLAFALNEGRLAKERAKLGQGHSVVHIYPKELKELIIHLPSEIEQQKIASILSTWDKAIELKEKLIEQKKEQKKGLMQKLLTGELRFPGYDGKWEKVDFEEVFIRIPVKKYQIKTTEYLKSGKFPVIDQGKQKIVAYSNNAEKVYQVESKGVIVFGDHTRERKFIDFDFIVGADGTQVLDTNDGYNNKFYFYCLLHQNIPNTGYNRHFKFLKEMWFFKPSLNEQVKIAEILSKIDKEIDLINKELEELKHQKQGLMQQLLTGKIRVKV